MNLSDFFASGRIIDSDPLDATTDAQIGFREYRVHPETVGNFWTSKLDAVGQAVLGICIFSATKCSVIGTATIVASGIALTATHVLLDFRDRIISGEIEILLIGFSCGEAVLWQVASVTPIPESDLSILSLALRSKLPPGNIFEIPVISLRLPQHGEKVCILGFRELEAERQGNTLSTKSRLFHSVGLVTQHFPNGRGNAFPGPHLAVSCNTPGGVSGGAAYDQNGNLIGLLSTSFEQNDGQGPSFVSILTPAIGQSFPVHWLASNPGSMKTRLIDIQQGHCNFEDRESIKVEDLGNGSIKLTYDDGQP